MMLHQIMERFDRIEDRLRTYYMIDGRTYYKSSEIKEFFNKKGKNIQWKQ